MRLARLTALTIAACLCTALVPLNDSAATPTSTPLHELTIELRDHDSGLPMTARVGVITASNVPLAPTDPQLHAFQFLAKKSYFYVDDSITLIVPEGDLRVHAGHGFEYTPETVFLTVTEDVTVTIELERFADLNALGYYSGDTHVHITHGPRTYDLDATHLRLMTVAEDLNFVNSMEQSEFFTGQIDPLSDADHIIYFSKEHRNPDFSHMTLLGLKQWIPNSGCGDIYQACGLQLDAEVYEAVHAQGPGCAVIATHPFPHFDITDLSAWPGGGLWRAMPLDLAGGTIDAMDILCYTHAAPPEGTEHYYNALTAGFRLPPSAGSDAIMATGTSKPLGGYRVYVRLRDGEAFTMDSWIQGLVEGRSFVTNYPLISKFEVNGKSPGDTVWQCGTTLAGVVKVDCVVPFDEVVIYGDRGVIATLTSPLGPVLHLEQEFAFDPHELSWVVAIVNGTNGGSWHLQPAQQLFAQTAPIYIEGRIAPSGDDKDPHPQGVVRPFSTVCRDAGNFFIDMLAEVDSVFNADGIFTDSTKAAFDSSVAVAFNYFAGLCEDPPEPFQLLQPTAPGGVAVVADPTPRFLWERAVDYDPGDEVVGYRLIITEDDFDNPNFVADLPDTIYELPPWTILPARTYHWRVEALDTGGLVRISTPEAYTFYYDPTATGIGEDEPAEGWRIDGAYPNPFNPAIEISYSVDNANVPHELVVYDARGRRVYTLFDGARPPGTYSEKWNAVNDSGQAVASGVYFVRLAPSGQATQTQKVILLK